MRSLLEREETKKKLHCIVRRTSKAAKQITTIRDGGKEFSNVCTRLSSAH
jgi:hypothetical protein